MGGRPFGKTPGKAGRDGGGTPGQGYAVKSVAATTGGGPFHGHRSLCLRSRRWVHCPLGAGATILLDPPLKQPSNECPASRALPVSPPSRPTGETDFLDHSVFPPSREGPREGDEMDLVHRTDGRPPRPERRRWSHGSNGWCRPLFGKRPSMVLAMARLKNAYHPKKPLIRHRRFATNELGYLLKPRLVPDDRNPRTCPLAAAFRSPTPRPVSQTGLRPRCPRTPPSPHGG